MKIIRLIAVLTIIIGIIGWILSFSAKSPMGSLASAWKVTLIAGPIGIIMGIILIRKEVKYGLLLTVLNFLLLLSFGPMWFLGDLFNLLTGR